MKALYIFLLLISFYSFSFGISTFHSTSFAKLSPSSSKKYLSCNTNSYFSSTETPSSISNVLSIRAGKVKTKSKNLKNTSSSSNSSNFIFEKLNKLPPITRYIFSFSFLLTLLTNFSSIFSPPSPGGGGGSPTSSALANYLSYISLSNIYEIWRPFTFLLYHGPLSMNSVSNFYFLIIYLKNLEENFDNLMLKSSTPSSIITSSSSPSNLNNSNTKKNKKIIKKNKNLFNLTNSGNTVWFLFFQLVFLNLVNIIFQLPFLSQAFLFSIINTVCRLKPMEKIPFQFGLIITSWQLPFALMCIEYLTNQSFSSILPHLIGIFSSHVFLFFTYIWPSLGGKKYLSTPKIFYKLFGEPFSELN